MTSQIQVDGVTPRLPGNERPLTVVDRMFLESQPIATALVSPGEPDFEHIAKCFRDALVAVPAFASRIVTSSRGDIALKFQADGARFQRAAKANLSRHELDNTHVDLLSRPLPSTLGSHTAALCVTPLNDGFAVCLSTSHVVGDGVSHALLFLAFIAACQGTATPPMSPQRLFQLSGAELRAIEPTREAVGATTQRAQPDCEHIRLEADEISRILPEVGGSVNQAATVLLLRAYRERLFAGRASIRLRVPVNLRGLLPGLDATYVGNAFVDAFMELSEDDVDGPVSLIGDKSREAVARVRKGDLIQRIMRLGPQGLEPLPAWADNQFEFESGRDAILSSLLGHVPAVVDLGYGQVTILSKAPTPRGFLILPTKTQALAVQVRL
jgi:hypothetical protein